MFNAFMGGDLDDDPIFGFHNRAMSQMNAMMNSVMSDAFGDMMGIGGFGLPMLGPMGPMAAGQMMHHQPQQRRRHPGVPHMPGMLQPFDLLGAMRPNDGLSFSTSSMTSMTIGPDGRPQVYQATSSTRSAPGGVKETKKTVSDSRSGTKKMAIGHHIGERAHIVEKSQNVRTGQREEHVELVNLSDDETEDFNHEWESATRGYGPRPSSNQRRIAHYGGVTIEDVTEDPNRQQLALPAPSPSTSHSSSQRTRHPKTVPSTSHKSHERAKKRDHGSGGGSSSSRAPKQHRSKQNY